MKIVFMGTPGFAVPALEALIKEFEVAAVLTQPDKQRGRGKKVTYSPIKEVALNNEIEIYQPQRLRKDTEVIDRLKSIEPDFIVVVAYGQILSEEVLNIPKYACVNLHASLLPKYRGAAPINWAIINGEKVSGNTTMLMDVGMDTGDMLLKNEVEITDDMTATQLHDKLSETGGEMLVKTLKGIVDGSIKGLNQNDEDATYAPKLDKNLAKIDWNSHAADINNLIRGLNQFPGAFTNYGDKVMKIYKADVIDNITCKENHIGEIVSSNKEGIVVQCKDSQLMLRVIQFPGKKAMKVEDFLRGNKIENGVILK